MSLIRACECTMRKFFAKVQQKMHICKKIARKFTFKCDFLANGLHTGSPTKFNLWGVICDRTFEEGPALAGGVTEGTTVSLNARAEPASSHESLLSGAIFLQMGCIRGPRQSPLCGVLLSDRTFEEGPALAGGVIEGTTVSLNARAEPALARESLLSSAIFLYKTYFRRQFIPLPCSFLRFYLRV